MKKTLYLFTSILFVLLLALPASAKESSNTYIEYLDDESYYVVTVTTDSAPGNLTRAASKTISGSKKATCYKNGVAQWAITVSGTFTYDGSSAKATASSYKLSGFATGLSPTNMGSYTSGNKAIAYATVSSVYQTVTLSCSANGTLS